MIYHSTSGEYWDLTGVNYSLLNWLRNNKWITRVSWTSMTWETPTLGWIFQWHLVFFCLSTQNLSLQNYRKICNNLRALWHKNSKLTKHIAYIAYKMNCRLFAFENWKIAPLLVASVSHCNCHTVNILYAIIIARWLIVRALAIKSCINSYPLTERGKSSFENKTRVPLGNPNKRSSRSIQYGQ